MSKVNRVVSRIIFVLPVLIVLAAIFIPLGAEAFNKPAEEEVYFEYIPPERIVLSANKPKPMAHPGVQVNKNEFAYFNDIPLDREWQYYTQEMCEKYDVPYSLMLGLFETESAFDFEADSGWAYGIGQIGYINFEWLTDLGMDPYTKEGNIEASVYMISDLLGRYDDVHKALMAYNEGEYAAMDEWENGRVISQYSIDVSNRAIVWGNYISGVNSELE